MTIRDLFDGAVQEASEAVFQRFHDGRRWVARTYGQTAERVHRAAALLKDFHLGDYTARLKPPRIAIMMENCPDWQVLYLAAAGAALAVVPIDPHLRAGEVRHILADSGARVVFCGVRESAVVREAAAGLDLVQVVDPGKALDALGADEVAAGARWYQAHRPTEETLASLIYTSGTTGRPKGAMLDHRCFTANAEQTLKRVPFFRTDCFLNVLPLFHAFSFMGNFVLPMRVRGSVGFMRNLRTLADDMRDLRPTVLLAVPLLAEKLYGRIERNIQKSPFVRTLYKMSLTRRLVAKKVVARFGGMMRLIGIGGAPTAVKTLNGFRAIGLEVLEGYGITECSPGVAYPDPATFVPGTVGPVLPGVQWKLGPQDETGAGELLVKGDNVMRGYWNNPEQTAAAFDEEGYYRTGDVVRIVDGNVKICGRTKALIVNREGKNIYPEEVENALEHAPLIRDAIVVGYTVGKETGEHVGAIIVPDAEALQEAFPGRTLSRAETVDYLTAYAKDVCRRSVAEYKQPRKFEVRFEPLERTGTMKVRRAVYARQLDEPGTARA